MKRILVGFLFFTWSVYAMEVTPDVADEVQKLKREVEQLRKVQAGCAAQVKLLEAQFEQLLFPRNTLQEAYLAMEEELTALHYRLDDHEKTMASTIAYSARLSDVVTQIDSRASSVESRVAAMLASALARHKLLLARRLRPESPH